MVPIVSGPVLQTFGERINLQRVIKFLSVGAVCTVLQYVLFFGILKVSGFELWWQITAVNALAFIASTQTNYLLSFHFTWSDRKKPVHGFLGEVASLVKFNLMALTSLIANTFVFGVFILVLSHLPSLIAGTVAGLVLSYIVSHRFVFATKHHEPQVTVIIHQKTSSEGKA